MSVVEVGGAKVAYRVEGKGPGLVLVHGTGGNSETNWTQVVGRLFTRTPPRPFKLPRSTSGSDRAPWLEAQS
jgi:pimeloyl-ACP methyl ester carboxylesterase